MLFFLLEKLGSYDTDGAIGAFFFRITPEISIPLLLAPWKQAKPNELLRFKLTGAEEELVDVAQSEGGVMRGAVHELRFDKRCSKLRPMADTWSKVTTWSVPTLIAVCTFVGMHWFLLEV